MSNWRTALVEPPLRLAVRAFSALPAAMTRRLAGPPIEIDGQVLDAEVQTVLRGLQRVGGEDFDLLPPADARRQLDQMARIFRGRRVRIRDVRELRIGGAAGPLRARLYSNVEPREVTGLVVYFHGGGWTVGSLESHDQTCRFLARESGLQVLAVDYRLAPEHPFPAGLDDAIASYRWAREHATELGADPTQVAVAGDSAGGNLATVVARETAVTGDGPAMQALLYPVCDISRKTRSYELFGKGFFLTERQMDWYGDNYVPERERRTDPRVSPLLAKDLSASPPAFIAVSGFDPLRDEVLAYSERLRNAGVSVEARLHSGLIHGFANGVGVTRSSAPPLRELAHALRAGCGGARSG